MADHLAARAFHHTEGLSDWRVCDGGASAWFDAPDLATGLRFALAVATRPECLGHPPDVDARPTGVVLRLSTFGPGPDGLSTLDAATAHAASEVARKHGLADQDGNEACVATWIGTDGQGYPD